MRDRDRIIHSKAFRRLQNKTQVFISPDNDHFRTRLTHSLEVMQIATDIAKAVRLNSDLTEAIALGHDLGHSPFGHTGESALNKCYMEVIESGRFKHSEFSLRIVDELEFRGDYTGLNLTWEVRDGILNHSKGLTSLSEIKDSDNLPQTFEGALVRIVDRIAYINHDLDDALRAEYIKINDLPCSLKPVLSKGTSYIINYFASDLISNFLNYEEIKLSPEREEILELTREFLTERLYSNEETAIERKRATNMITELFYYYLTESEKSESKYSLFIRVRKIVDYIAGMTDRFAINSYNEKIAGK